MNQRSHVIPIATLVSVLYGSVWAGVHSAAATPSCQVAGPPIRIPELHEASGIAVSRRSPGRLWAHNDSGEPVLIALDTKGSVTGRVRLSGATVEDWEAMTVGPCASGSCLFVGDIGDNDAARARITIYRIPEPSGDESVDVKDVFHATYPEGPRDAETLLAGPDGRLFVVTKGETDAVSLYQFPAELHPGADHQLERVGKPQGSSKLPKNRRITDGAVTPDGAWVVLRTNDELVFHPAADFFSGKWTEAGRFALKGAGERQGEGVAIGANGALYLAGEGGGKTQPGTFATGSCSMKSQPR
jgi:hypothetical protein